MIILEQKIKGSILDIGGGGDGIIGRLYGSQVVAIDNLQEELDEAPNGFEKILMDARCLSYSAEKFDNVTFFYSLMFMSTETQKQAISEAYRVLKNGGLLHIWDADILIAYPKPFIVNLDIQLPSELIHTTYGIVNDIQNQSATSVTALCCKHGFELIEQNSCNGQFDITFKKAT